MPHTTTAHDLLEVTSAAEPLVVDAAVTTAGIVSRIGSLLRCEVLGGWWLLDPKHRRLCRTTDRHDPVFIGDEHWEPFRRAAVSPEWAVAELLDGRVLRAAVAGATPAA
jgi:hypothetical protein